MAYDEQDLIGLSDEERASLLDEEEETTGDAEDEPEEAEQEEEPEDEPAEEAPAETPGEAAEAPDEPPPAPRDEAFVAQYSPQIPEDLDTQLTGIEEKKRELRTKYQEGDLEFDAYEEQRDVLEREERKLEGLKLAAQMEQERTQQTMAQRWTWEQERFFEDRHNQVFRDNPVMREGFNATLRELSQDEANGSRSMRWFLEEGAKLTRQRAMEALGIQEAPAKPEAKAQAKPAVKAAKKAPIPPNLGDMPAASLPETNADEFAHLDKLSGLELEYALSRLSEVEKERYLRA